MKKRILSILLTLCMVLMLCPVTALAEEGKTVSFTVTADKTEAQPGETINFTVTMGAVDRLGYLMLGLSIPEGMTYVANSGTVPEGLKEKMSAENVEFFELPYLYVLSSDYTSTADTVLMTFQCTVNDDATPGDKAVGVCLVYDDEGGCLDVDSKVIAATFTPATVTVPEPALAITVDGFEVGNTPEDITLSFESTIPGVEFSEEDILANFGGWEYYREDVEEWLLMRNTEVFEAGTRYRCAISLDNKGLTVAPAVTVNGKTPEYCGIATRGGTPYALAITCELGTPPEPVNNLDITVDGFEVGKTPADCTFSFESTIPGIEFSAADIAEIFWKFFDGQGYHNLQDTDTFDADKTYSCYIRLSPKGLTSAPAATVNGNTPFYCDIIEGLGPQWLCVYCNMGEPAPTITIDGPDVVCAQQDYEFTATPSDGVTLDETFGYDLGGMGSGVELTIDEDGVGHGVLPAELFKQAVNGFDVNAHGYTADQQFVITTKHVEISPEHIYVDGVCGCGAKSEYTITYEGGEGVEGSIPAGVKARGEAFTLSSDTFTREGFVQTGWVDESGAIYDLGGDYMLDEDMTFYPYWEKRITLTVPYTTTVALGDAGEPGETAFDLALVGSGAGDYDAADVTVSGSVTTDGAGDYNGTLAITGPEWTLWHLLSEGAFVQQVDAGADGWTVDDTVWGLLMSQAAALSDDAAAGYTLLVVPASVDEFGNYGIDWNAIDWEDPQSADMTFTNTYTAHAYELKHDATHHWDECACKDVQNKELHKYGDWKVTKEATETAVGEKEHTCTVCGYVEKVEIAKLSGTNTTKPGTDTVQTGDNSNLTLWFALFAVSAAGMIGIGVYSKRKTSSRAK